MAKPLYRHIEFCHRPQTLWGKIESGRWDWLGVHPEGQFVLGSPAAGKGLQVKAALSVRKAGADEGSPHMVTIESPGAPTSTDRYPTAEAARAGYATELERLGEGEDPQLFRVRLIEGGYLAEEEYVVQRPTTYR